MKYEMVVFDFDDTLAPLYGNMSNQTIENLRKLNELGVKIVISSGKPVFYICGLVKHLNIDDIIIIGENGAHIQFGYKLPPKSEYYIGYNDEIIEYIGELKQDIMKDIGDKVWVQPTMCQVAFFYRDLEDIEFVNSYLKNKIKNDSKLELKMHADAVDLGLTVDKGIGLRILCNDLCIPTRKTIAVGNASNDYPMFEVAEESIGINLEDREKAKINVLSIDEAFNEIYKLLDI